MATIEKTPETETKSEDNAARAARRKARLDRIAAQNKVTVILDTDVRKFIEVAARTNGMDLTNFMKKLVENYVVDTAPEDLPLAVQLRAKRAVIDRIVTEAQTMIADGGFDEHFVLNVTRKASQDAAFMALYQAAIAPEAAEGSDDKAATKRAERARLSLNQQIGRVIKQAAEAKSKRQENGRIARAQVQGEIISTYTLLTKAA